MNPVKIVIVEDTPEILEITAKILKSRGYNVIPVEDGKTAFDEVKKNQPDLVFLDMFLNDIEGTDICHAIKSDPVTAHIPVIITTGHAPDHSSSPLKKPDHYLNKPFEPEDLVEAINKFVKK
jgi:CheY-like chemotaxis protein